jgi:putative hydrolase of the HAD superfamily
MPFTTILFDLDDTLYPTHNGLWQAIRERMNDYITKRLGLPREAALELRRAYFERYGTTLRGLQHHHQVDSNDFLAYVHDLPLDQYIHPDPALGNLLRSLPQQRWVFTNADAPHARRVLAALGVADCFSGIIDIHATNFRCKPEKEAYLRALALAGEVAPHNCLFCDDAPRNLAPARALGIFTVRVGSADPDPAADRSIASLHDLPKALPELWGDKCIFSIFRGS